MSVVVFHAFPNLLEGGFIGVDIFFVISGFLITGHILEQLNKGEFSFSVFFGKRIRRIFPALILVMASSLAFGWFVLLADEYEQLGKHIAAGAAFIINFVFVDESGYFDNASETKPMLHLWSLAVEEQFYIIWPLILWIALKIKISLLKTTIFVMVVSLLINLVLLQSKPIEMFFWPVGRFWELLSGSVLAWIMLYRPHILTSSKFQVHSFCVYITRSKIILDDDFVIVNIMSFLGFLLLGYGIIAINKEIAFPSIWTMIPIFGAILIICSGSKAWLNRIVLMNPIAVWFGLISYPLYLWHWPILSFMQIIDGQIPDKETRILAIFISIFLAWLTYLLIEIPIRKRTRMAPRAIHLFMFMMVIGLLGLLVKNDDGIKNRSYTLQYNMNLDELNRTVAKENLCLAFLGLSETKFNYCKIGKVKNEGVVAVIGDSHAHVAFPGISQGLEPFGITTILLANSSCPPFEGAPSGRNVEEKKGCSERIEQILSSLETIDDLRFVLVFSRGPAYWTGTEPARKKKKSPSLEKEVYFAGLQKTVVRIHALGIEVVYVTENPELKYQARSCLPRPLNNTNARRCVQDMSSVLKRQGEYRDHLSKIKNLTILDSNKAFCIAAENKCFAVNDNGALLYADDNHLSVIGSEWQFHKLIKGYFVKTGLIE